MFSAIKVFRVSGKMNFFKKEEELWMTLTPQVEDAHVSPASFIVILHNSV